MCLLYRQVQLWQSHGAAASPNLFLSAFSGETSYLCLTPLMEGKVLWLVAFNALLHWRGSSDPSVGCWGWCLASRQEMGGAVEIILLPCAPGWPRFSPCCSAFIKTPCLEEGFAELCRSLLQCSLQRGRAAVSHSGSAGEFTWARFVWGWGWTLTWHLSAYTQCRQKRIKKQMSIMYSCVYSYNHMYTYTHILKSIYTFLSL